MLTGGRFIYASALRLAVLKFILSMTVWALRTAHRLLSHQAMHARLQLSCSPGLPESLLVLSVPHCTPALGQRFALNDGIGSGIGLVHG